MSTASITLPPRRDRFAMHHQGGAQAAPDDPFGGGADEHVKKPALAMRAKDDQFGLRFLGGREDLFEGVTAAHQDLGRVDVGGIDVARGPGRIGGRQIARQGFAGKAFLFGGRLGQAVGIHDMQHPKPRLPRPAQDQRALQRRLRAQGKIRGNKQVARHRTVL